MINGHTKILAHIGYPTTTFRAPMIYNPWFDSKGINAAVVPMGVRPENFASAFPEICRFSNFAGALVTMPHKISVVDLLDEVSTEVKIAGSCNAVRREADGRLIGDMFDGAGFVRGLVQHGVTANGKRTLIVGSGGVGSAIAASTAAAGAKEIALYDTNVGLTEKLAGRLKAHYPNLVVSLGSKDPAGFDIAVNATPLGMNAGDPLPMDPARLAPSTFVVEVVLKSAQTPFLAAARARGCATQIGVDMLFEQIPAYLEFFGFEPPTAAELRAVAKVEY